MAPGATTLLLRSSAVLWVVWGSFHLLLGIALMAFIGAEHPIGQLSEIPELLEVTMMDNPARFASVASLKQHAYNLAWIGAVVTVGAGFVWKGDPRGIFFNAVVAGFADLGYFIFFDLAGYADPPGPQMTWICVGAIVLSLVAYFGARPGASRPHN